MFLNTSKTFNDIFLTLGSSQRITAITKRSIVGYPIFKIILFNHMTKMNENFCLDKGCEIVLNIAYLTSVFFRIATAIVEKSIVGNFPFLENL